MPRETIGQWGCAQYPDRRWITGELELAIYFIRHACGDPPSGYQLEILWHEHDLGEYATVGVSWEGPGDAPWDYISRAEEALECFQQAVSWSDLAPYLKSREADEIEETSGEDDDAEISQSNTDSELSQLIELYRRDEMLGINLSDWETALHILQEEGWQPTHPANKYARPLWFITQDEGKEMERVARSLFAKMDNDPALSSSVPIDLGVLYRLTEFLGGGSFVVGAQGSFANAAAADFSD